jgi:hypothetical protein
VVEPGEVVTRPCRRDHDDLLEQSVRLFPREQIRHLVRARNEVPVVLGRVFPEDSHGLDAMHRTSGVDLHPVNAEAFVPLDSGLDHGKTVCRGSPDARRLFVRRDAARHKNDSRQIEFGHDLLRDDHVPLMHGVESPPEDPNPHAHLTGSRTPSRRS